MYTSLSHPRRVQTQGAEAPLSPPLALLSLCGQRRGLRRGPASGPDPSPLGRATASLGLLTRSSGPSGSAVRAGSGPGASRWAGRAGAGLARGVAALGTALSTFLSFQRQDKAVAPGPGIWGAMAFGLSRKPRPPGNPGDRSLGQGWGLRLKVRAGVGTAPGSSSAHQWTVPGAVLSLSGHQCPCPGCH